MMTEGMTEGKFHPSSELMSSFVDDASLNQERNLIRRGRTWDAAIAKYLITILRVLALSGGRERGLSNSGLGGIKRQISRGRSISRTVTIHFIRLTVGDNGGRRLCRVNASRHDYNLLLPGPVFDPDCLSDVPILDAVETWVAFRARDCQDFESPILLQYDVQMSPRKRKRESKM